MVLASTTMRPYDVHDIDEFELAEWARRGILLDTKATTEEGRIKAALRQCPIDGPSATTPAPDAVRADRSRARAPKGADATPRRRAKKASPAADGPPPDGGATEAPANPEAAPPRENEAPEAQKETDPR